MIESIKCYGKMVRYKAKYTREWVEQSFYEIQPQRHLWESVGSQRDTAPYVLWKLRNLHYHRNDMCALRLTSE